MSLFLFANTAASYDVDGDVFGLDLLVVELTPLVVSSLREQADVLNVVVQAQPGVVSLEYLDETCEFYGWRVRQELPPGLVEGLDTQGWELYRDNPQEVRKLLNSLDGDADWELGSRVWLPYLNTPQFVGRAVEIVWSATPRQTSIDVRSTGVPWESLKEFLEEEHV